MEIKQIHIKAIRAVETVRLWSLKLTVFAEKPRMNISFHFDASIFPASFVRGLPNINSGPDKNLKFRSRYYFIFFNLTSTYLLL